MLLFIIIVLLIIAGVYIFMQQPMFGKAATGERLQRKKASPNYKDGKFENQHFTPSLTEGYTFSQVFYEFLFKRTSGRKPIDAIPSIKTNLHHLSMNDNVLIWFGHSSYYLQIDGKRFLVDPVFSGNASPLKGSNTAFNGSDIYNVNDLPLIDYLIITHDHYDHADYETLKQLPAKTKMVITGLGVGAHLEHWGFNAQNIIEKDWNEQVDLEDGFTIYTKPARHFSGRSFNRNSTLWLSILLQTPSTKIYIGGDSGYDTHFAEIGNDHGPIDLAILENGQYDIKWKYIHMSPEEVLQAGKDLKAKSIFPVHSGKFAMANHTWQEPLEKITELNKTEDQLLITPIIGEPVYIKKDKAFTTWWQGIK